MARTNEHGQPVGEPVAWSPREPPGPVELTGSYVRLVPLGLEHAEAIVTELAAHPQLWTYRSDDPPADVAQAREWIQTRLGGPDQVYVVLRRGDDRRDRHRFGDDRLQGLCTLLRTDVANGVTEVGAIIYAPELQRTPASTEVTHLIARYVFDDLGYRRLEWKCDSLNEPSRRAAERLGFTYEGRFRQAVVYRGRNRDTDWFAIIDADWPRIRAAHERWLAPENFDPAGRQRMSLREL